MAQNSTGIPIMSAYQRLELFAAPAIELETKPSKPSVSAASSGVSEAASDASPEPGDADEGEGQQPDEEPVRKRAGDDPAADFAVTLDRLERHVDRIVSLAFDARALRAPSRPPGSWQPPATWPDRTVLALLVSRPEQIGRHEGNRAADDVSSSRCPRQSATSPVGAPASRIEPIAVSPPPTIGYGGLRPTPARRMRRPSENSTLSGTSSETKAGGRRRRACCRPGSEARLLGALPVERTM